MTAVTLNLNNCQHTHTHAHSETHIKLARNTPIRAETMRKEMKSTAKGARGQRIKERKMRKDRRRCKE